LIAFEDFADFFGIERLYSAVVNGNDDVAKPRLPKAVVGSSYSQQPPTITVPII
jgi:hypothetical protein